MLLLLCMISLGTHGLSFWNQGVMPSLPSKSLLEGYKTQKNSNIGSIRSDHGGESQNEKFRKFCEKMGILHNFSASRTPQQNGLVERKNRSLKELARTMLIESSLPKYFWVDAISTSCYVMNRVLDGDQAQVDMEANQQDQEEVEAQMEDTHGGQSPPQRLTRSMFKALGAGGHLFSLFVISLVEGA